MSINQDLLSLPVLSWEMKPQDVCGLTPLEIVRELDRYIVGQKDAKKCVANALRNRWRRAQLSKEWQQEIMPKNILMIGPTGVGKTEIARRISRLMKAPFIKVEATKFTEIGYVGRDVEQMIRDLVEVSISMMRSHYAEGIKPQAQERAEDRIVEALVGDSASNETRNRFKKRLKGGELEESFIDIEVAPSKSNAPVFDLPSGVQMGMINFSEMLGKGFGDQSKRKRLRIDQARVLLIEEESEKLIDQEQIIRDALLAVEQNGIVFIDEIDKICEESSNGKVSREGVQRDLIPLLEGTSVPTKHGVVKTDHILFITSGAFHVAKPSDLLPELQGRLPIRVALLPLGVKDFLQILTVTECNLVSQYEKLLSVEEVTLTVKKEALEVLAELSVKMNTYVENIGARRLHTLLEKLLEDISFSAGDHKGENVTIDAEMVKSILEPMIPENQLRNLVL